MAMNDASYPDSVARAIPATQVGVPSQAQPKRRSADPGHRPSVVLARLLDGNRRFFSNASRYGPDVTVARQRAERPTPSALVIGCIDSRVPPEGIFDQDFGELLVVRTAGHVLDTAALASVRLAVTKMGVSLIVVLGHEACAAVEYAVDATHRGEHPDGELAYLVDQIAPSVPMAEELSGTQTYEGAVRAHVAATVAAVRRLPDVARATAAGDVAVAGLRYGVTYGRAQVIVEP